LSTARQLRSAHAAFDGKRLTQARLSRGLRKKDLSDLIGVTPAAVGQYEQGISAPSSSVIAELSLALSYPPKFFKRGRQRFEISHEECHFRRLRSTSKLERSRVLARAELLMELVDVLERYGLRFPPVDLPDDLSSYADSLAHIEDVAVELRKEWGLGIGPIDNMVRLLENKGCIVTRLHSESESVNAFSAWMTKRPLIVLSSDKGNVERSRFDAAHELAHLVFHHDAEPGSRRIEEQAHKLGAAFLMPANAIKKEFPRRFAWEKYFDLKERWKVSLAALVRRARDLSIISEATYKRAMVQYSQNGWRNGEPGNLRQPEQPVLIPRALSMIEERFGIDQATIASELCVQPADFRILTSVQGDATLFVSADEPNKRTSGLNEQSEQKA
jgi:Zn-dependent peptidase ImmA (M78 family)/transcriptional regulator with XRE-family HTH domain